MTTRDGETRAIRTLRPKRRIRARFLVGTLLFYLAIFGAYGVWGGWLEHRLNARLAALHAAGEPVHPADFEVPEPRQNGADDIVRAGALVEWSEAQRAYDRLTWYYCTSPGLPLKEVEAKAIARVVTENIESLALIESGLANGTVQWPANVHRPPIDQDHSWLNPVRGAAILMRLHVLHAHRQGRYADAVRELGRILDLARSVDGDPSMVAHLFAGGIDDMAADTVEDLSYDLPIGGPGWATEAGVRELIGRLLDDRPTRAGLVRARQGERAGNVLWMRSLADHEFKGVFRPLGRYGVRPMTSTSAWFGLRLESVWIDAFRNSRNLPTLLASPEVTAMSDEIARSKLDIGFVDTTVSLRGYAETGYRRVTNRRLAAVALAMRLYAFDHEGRLPAELSALVPAYLPAVPTDPMVSGPMPLRYRPTAVPAVVYSVGMDGVDDGGSERLRPGLEHRDPNEPVNRWAAVDAVLPLTRPARYIPPERPWPPVYGGRRVAAPPM